MRAATPIVLGNKERAMLTKLAHSQTSSVRLAKRARIVLLAAEGHENIEIAWQLRIGRVQAGRWRDRYREGGLAAIEHDLPRGGGKNNGEAKARVRLTTQNLPAHPTR